MTPINLKTPLSREDVEILRVGDIVTISGYIFTSRSQFHIRFIDNGHIPPLNNSQHNVMIHSGPIMEKVGEKWKMRAMSVTTSIRFDKWESEVIRRLGLRAIIGKGKVGRDTQGALCKYGCVHLGKTGAVGGAYATMVEKIEGVLWLELGLPEATWILRVKDFGPLVVTADTKGNSFFEDMSDHINSQARKIYRKLGIEDFTFAEK